MAEYTVTLSEEEEKALSVELVSVQAWLENAIHNKARKCINRVVEEYSDKQPTKISEADKKQIVRDANVETVAERSAIAEAGL